MTYASEVQADSPRHWWRCLEDASCNVVWDFGSGPVYPVGTQNAVPYLGFYGVAPDGGAAIFDGPARLAPIATLIDFAPPPYTVECWWWPYRDDTGVLAPIGQIDAGVTDGWQLGYVISGGHIQIAANDKRASAVSSAIGTTNITRGAWHHLVATHDLTNLRAYLDGALEATHACTPHNSTPIANLQMMGPLGYYAEFAIYPTALSGARILAHYNAADPTDPQFRPLANAGSLYPINTDLALILASVRRSY